MNIIFEKMNENHSKDVMDIFNYYVENTTSAFAPTRVPEQFYGMIVKRSDGYPSYTVIDKDKDCIIGFCQLSPYNPFSTFNETACITYFISKDYTGKGIGSQCLAKLEEGAKNMGLKNIIAEVSSENKGSISFHERHGFVNMGELKNIGMKLNRSFGIVYMQKQI